MIAVGGNPAIRSIWGDYLSQPKKYQLLLTTGCIAQSKQR
jgi:hypothetical protein